MIPVEITVLALLIFMAWQSIFGWVKDRAQQQEINELKLALLALKKTVDENVAYDLGGLDERLKRLEPPAGR
jgi:hypothetical protein